MPERKRTPGQPAPSKKGTHPPLPKLFESVQTPRTHFREGRSIKGGGNWDLGASRAPVRKVLRSGATEFVCERRTQPRPKIGPWQSELDRFLEENAARPKRGLQPMAARGTGRTGQPAPKGNRKGLA